MPSHSATSISSNASDIKLENKTRLTAVHCFPQNIRDHHHHSDRVDGDRNLAICSAPGYHSHSQATLSVEGALHIIKDRTPTPIAIDSPVNSTIIGSIFAEDVYADIAVPAYRVSAVDGYAVHVEEDKPMKNVFPEASIASASVSGCLEPLQPGSIAQTATGDPLPPNVNAVVRVEDTLVGPEEGTIKILTDDIAIGQNMREPGSYIALNSQIFARGDHLSPVSGAVSLLAMAGIQTVRVFQKARVGVLSMGNGLVEDSRRIRGASRLAVLSALVSWGFETVDLGIVHNTSDGELEHALRTSADVILITNEPSINGLHLKPTIECALGGTIHFNRVLMKPGSQITFATIPVHAAETALQGHASRLIFSLPSDPASALVTLNLLVLPSLQKFSGLSENSCAVAAKPWMAPQLGLPRVAVVLTHHLPLDPKQTEYHLATVTGSRSDARLYATSINDGAVGARDSRSGCGTTANALIILRAGRGVGIKGEIVEALLMGPIDGSDIRLIC